MIKHEITVKKIRRFLFAKVILVKIIPALNNILQPYNKR